MQKNLTIEKNIDLSAYHTFGCAAMSRYFFRIKEEKDLYLLDQLPEPHLILGAGSNVLLEGTFEGTILKNELRGINFEQIDDQTIILKAAAGENWHQIVLFTLEKNWGGLENLALIPGTIGAAPMQNIGAYGVELADIFDHLEAFDLKEKKTIIFKKADCHFGYRESIFKNQYKNRFIITKVALVLTQKNHRFCIDYQPLAEKLADEKNTLTPQKIAQAVIEIRSSKLPDPQKIGSAGSFFKNPTISKIQFEKIIQHHPQLPHFLQENGSYKIPAAFLIEKMGFKGKTIEDRYGVYPLQPLVLVHYKNAKAKEIWTLAQEIIATVHKNFGIVLEPEVQYYEW